MGQVLLVLDIDIYGTINVKKPPTPARHMVIIPFLERPRGHVVLINLSEKDPKCSRVFYSQAR